MMASDRALLPRINGLGYRWLGAGLALGAVLAAGFVFSGLSAAAQSRMAWVWWPHAFLVGLLLLNLVPPGGALQARSPSLPWWALLGVSVAAIAGTRAGAGPFAALPAGSTTTALGSYLGSLVAMMWAGHHTRQRLQDRAVLALADQPLRPAVPMDDTGGPADGQLRHGRAVSLFEHLNEGLLITDADLRVLDANTAASQILNVPPADLIGQVPTLLQPTHSDPLARQQRAALWVGLHQQGRWRGELIDRRRDGRLRTLQTTISQVYGPGDELLHHVLAIYDVTEQRTARDRLERQAHFDALTQLPNRARLRQLLDDALRAADRDGYLLIVCCLDLDRFKPINEQYGHAGGDRLLVELARRLGSALRSRDHWTDVAARPGGDEFVLLLRARSMDEARLAIERVLRVVAQPYAVDPAREPAHITASLGATVYPIDRSDADTLLRHADHAMYGAKQSGRNAYRFFDPEQSRRTEERVSAIGRVQEALDQAEFALFYQPIVDIRSQRVIGMEALLRWQHPDQGLIAPMQFLPLITDTGLSARIGDWALSQALSQLAQWHHAGLVLQVHVNISARHLQEPDFVQRLSELLAAHPEPLAGLLKLEIVESEAHADLAASSQLLARCRALGVHAALDDFGTGHSTLTHLQRLPVDVLKIDRSFVRHMLDDPQDRALVQGVIGLARTFGCAVVAEGVETPAQARMLLELGCDSAQGSGIATPMPADQVADWVRSFHGFFAPADTASQPAPGGTPPPMDIPR